MGRSRFHQNAEKDNRARNRFSKTLRSEIDRGIDNAYHDLTRREDARRRIQLAIRAILSGSDEPVTPRDLEVFAAFMQRHHLRFSQSNMDTDLVDVARYHPARDVACQICGVTYGTVGVAGRGSEVRSHEAKFDGNDSSVFLPRTDTIADRSTWQTWQQEQEDKEAAALRSIRRRVSRYRHACEDATAAELQAALAESGI